MFAAFEEVARIIRAVAAAEIVPRFRKLAATEIRQKNHPRDLVTVADEQAEQSLTSALTALLPGSGAVGEEAAAKDARVLDALAGAAPVWVIDPVDGTQNFVRGIACFSVLVGLCQAGEVVAGWSFDPLAGVMVWAGRGGGAFREDRGGRRRLHIATGRALADLEGSVDRRNADRLAARRLASLAPVPAVRPRLGSTGCEYIALASGTLDFALYRRLKPWDHAAGALIFTEAGGCARLRGGATPYRPAPAILEETLLLAPDRALWDRLDALLV
jgi:fructose-1,6-bisphosphatase/inositol monophosphatase family enzyme